MDGPANTQPYCHVHTLDRTHTLPIRFYFAMRGKIRPNKLVLQLIWYWKLLKYITPYHNTYTMHHSRLIFIIQLTIDGSLRNKQIIECSLFRTWVNNRSIPFPSVQWSRLVDWCIETTSTYWFWPSATHKRLTLRMFTANHTRNKTQYDFSRVKQNRGKTQTKWRFFPQMTTFPVRQRKTLETNSLLTIVPSCGKSESFPLILLIIISIYLFLMYCLSNYLNEHDNDHLHIKSLREKKGKNKRNGTISQKPSASCFTNFSNQLVTH